MKTLIYSIIISCSISFCSVAHSQDSGTYPDCIKFMEASWDFGEVPLHTAIQHSFVFTNEGKEPVSITAVNTSGIGLLPRWNKQVVLPGKSDSIMVWYGVPYTGKFDNTATVIFDKTYIPPKVIHFKGNSLSGEKIVPAQIPDSVPGAVLKFDTYNWNFGDVPEGIPANHYFKVTNASPNPVLISIIQCASGCETGVAPREEILPGKSAVINAIYCAASMGPFIKSCTVIEPGNVMQNFYITGFVLSPKPKDKATLGK